MGTNIAIFTENRRGGKWRPADPLVKSKLYVGEEPVVHRKQPYSGRNYELFAILAGVRNRYDIKPIALPKGLPQDLSREIRQEANKWLRDERICSYLTLAELQAYDWHGQTFLRHVSLGADEYEQYMRTGRAETWNVYGGLKGMITNMEMFELVRSGQAGRERTTVSWPEHYAEPAKDFIEAVLPKLEALAKGDADSVRIVFSFDLCCRICAALAGIELAEVGPELGLESLFWYCRE